MEEKRCLTMYRKQSPSYNHYQSLTPTVENLQIFKPLVVLVNTEFNDQRQAGIKNKSQRS